MKLDLHTAVLAGTTLGAGWLMMTGLRKRVLELRRPRRICPSCGTQIRARTCRSCATVD
jgi:hypothetical protein